MNDTLTISELRSSQGTTRLLMHGADYRNTAKGVVYYLLSCAQWPKALYVPRSLHMRLIDEIYPSERYALPEDHDQMPGEELWTRFPVPGQAWSACPLLKSREGECHA